MTATQKCHCQLTYAIFCHSHNQINTLQSFIKMELVFNESFFMKCCYISCPQKLFPHNNSHCNLHNGVKMLCILTSFESIFMCTWNKTYKPILPPSKSSMWEKQFMSGNGSKTFSIIPNFILLCVQHSINSILKNAITFKINQLKWQTLPHICIYSMIVAVFLSVNIKCKKLPFYNRFCHSNTTRVYTFLVLFISNQSTS